MSSCCPGEHAERKGFLFYQLYCKGQESVLFCLLWNYSPITDISVSALLQQEQTGLSLAITSRDLDP